MSETGPVDQPLTPEQAKAQVIAASREVVTILGVPVTQAWVGLDSCNDQSEAPFRGTASVHYPPAATVQSAQQDADQYLDKLRQAGWIPNPDFHSSAPNAEKNGVTIIVEVQGVGDKVRVLTVLGQCRDVTTTKQTRGRVEQFDAGE